MRPWVFLVLVSCLPTWSQGTWPYPEDETGVGPDEDAPAVPVFFDMRAAFPVDDFNMGGRVGFATPARGVATDVFFDFEMRPYRRAARVRESATLEYQFREERLTFGPGFLTRFPLRSTTSDPSDPAGVSSWFVAGAGAGLSVAWYRGSNRSAPTRGLIWLETGFRWHMPSGTTWGLAYQFFPLPNVSWHRLALSVGFRLEPQ